MCGSPVFQHYLLKRLSFSNLCVCAFVENQMSIMVWAYSGSLLAYMSVFCAGIMLFLSLWLCDTIWYQVLWCLQHCSFCLGLLWQLGVLCASIWIFRLSSVSVKNVIRILMQIELNLCIAFDNIVIFTLILPIHDHGSSFLLRISPAISFFSVL
jgi:hypothetical protein